MGGQQYMGAGIYHWARVVVVGCEAVVMVFLLVWSVGENLGNLALLSCAQASEEFWKKRE